MKLQTITPHFLPVERAQRVGRLLVLCAIVGVAAGLGAIALEWGTELLQHVLLYRFAGYRAGDHSLLRPELLAVLPIVGGLIGGFIVLKGAPSAAGSGADHAIAAYHHHRGLIPWRVPVVKMIASTITLGFGGSAGREGPIAQIGAGIGSVLATRLRLSVHERRLLMIAGMGAGIGAIFRAPLAGALFSAEVLYREMDLEFEVIVPAMISSIVGYSVFTLQFGSDRLFDTPPFVFGGPAELLPYFVLALVVAAGAKAFVVTFAQVRAFFTRLSVPPLAKPVIGGAVVGSFAFVLPEGPGAGYHLVQSAISGRPEVGFLVGAVLVKIIATSFTVGSGQSGGVFGPAIVIGGLLGCVVGLFFDHYVPQISPPVGAFVIVGMAGFFSAAANTPISTFIMVSEMTGNYDLLVPSMWVCVIAFLLVRRSTLYDNQIDQRTKSPVHLSEMMSSVLERLTVRDVLGDAEHEAPAVVRADATLPQIVEQFAGTHHAVFPVVDGDGRLLGVIDDEELRIAIGMEDLGGLLRARDLMSARLPALTPNQSLLAAMHTLVASRREELVVVDEQDKTKLVGTVSRRDLVSTYDHRLQKEGTNPSLPAL
ncbi:MAG: chloride channel protein [Deltaproteobacteria bacterium]